jgi:DNA-binding MarR family transcriptional regulator
MPDRLWEERLDRILELTVVLGRDMTEQLEGMGLTEARAHLIWELGRRGPCKQQALAEALGVSPRAITALVDGLVPTGFVTREPHPTDRRATQVTLTAHGQATAEALVDSHRELARQLFADVPADQLDCFDNVLVGLLERLRRIVAANSARLSRP